MVNSLKEELTSTSIERGVLNKEVCVLCVDIVEVCTLCVDIVEICAN